ncbi:unnamed protein product [Rangifer tarandus platyrhynchus]|uniref:Uncharacterized protein n=1 Tax=Rangifer tarandus platyrhynchus TaxID=3082113 RepID=A0AC59ZW72_RANTA
MSPETQLGTASGPSSSTHPATRQGCRAGEAEAPGAPPSPPALCRKGALLGAPGALYAQRPQESLATDVGVQWGGDGGPQDPAPRLFLAVCLSGCPIPRDCSTQDRGPHPGLTLAPRGSSQSPCCPGPDLGVSRPPPPPQGTCKGSLGTRAENHSFLCASFSSTGTRE